MSVKSKVVVAEDDAGIRDLIRIRLELAGYDVHTARDGVEALSRIRAVRPDALILDINMPELDGFGVLTALAEQRGSPIPPTMILTARHAADDVRRALDLGAKDYLAKPFNEAQLLARVARLLRPSFVPPPPGKEMIEA